MSVSCCVASLLQMASGFKRLLAAADDLVLDIPGALHLLSLFLGRAVVDEVLPPAFLAAALPGLPDGGLGVGVVQNTGERRFLWHNRRCWGWFRGGFVGWFWRLASKLGPSGKQTGCGGGKG